MIITLKIYSPRNYSQWVIIIIALSRNVLYVEFVTDYIYTCLEFQTENWSEKFFVFELNCTKNILNELVLVRQCVARPLRKKITQNYRIIQCHLKLSTMQWKNFTQLSPGSSSTLQKVAQGQEKIAQFGHINSGFFHLDPIFYFAPKMTITLKITFLKKIELTSNNHRFSFEIRLPANKNSFDWQKSVFPPSSKFDPFYWLFKLFACLLTKRDQKVIFPYQSTQRKLN